MNCTTFMYDCLFNTVNIGYDNIIYYNASTNTKVKDSFLAKANKDLALNNNIRNGTMRYIAEIS